MAITPLPAAPSRADPSNFAARADAFLGAMPTFADEVNDAAAAMNAAAQSALNAPGTSATSTSSVGIGLGAKGFTITTGKLFVVGQFVMVVSRGAPTNWMLGQITAHNNTAGSMTILVKYAQGTGTYTDWNIALSAPLDPTQLVQVDSSGQAGIGTTLPQAPLDVRKLAGGAEVIIASLSNRSSTIGTSVTIDLTPANVAVPNLRSAQINAYNDGADQITLSFRTSHNGSTPTNRWQVFSFGHLVPSADNAYSLATASLRASVIYAASGTIATSDAREKQWRGALTADELAVAKAIAGDIGIFQWLESIEGKGEDGARLHCGVKAQAAAAALVAEGLDPARYGFYCYDEWGPSPAQIDAEGHVVVAARDAGDRYGVRYDELWGFVLAGQEQRISALEQRLAALEAA